MARQIFVLVLLIGCTFGCATKSFGPYPLAESERQKLGTVLVQAVYESEETTQGITSGKGMGAAKGAGIATGEWLGMSLSTGEPISALVGIMLTPIATVAGTVYGGVVADSAEDVDNYKKILERELGQTEVSYERQVVQQLGQLSFVPTVINPSAGEEGTPHQSRLEINFRQLQGEGGGPKSELRFNLLTETKLYTGNQLEPIYVRDYKVASKVKRLSLWVENDGAVLRGAIDQLAHTTVNHILDDHFRSSAYHINASYPAKGYVFRPPRLDTTSPVFRWQLHEGRREVELVENNTLSFELRVVDDRGGLYEQTAIRADNGQLSRSLPSCGTYNWQVKAHYEVFGQPRSTNWSAKKAFRTPCDA